MSCRSLSTRSRCNSAEQLALLEEAAPASRCSQPGVRRGDGTRGKQHTSTTALLRRLPPLVRHLAERAIAEAERDPGRARRLPGYLRGLSAPEKDPDVRATLRELAKRMQTKETA